MRIEHDVDAMDLTITRENGAEVALASKCIQITNVDVGAVVLRSIVLVIDRRGPS